MTAAQAEPVSPELGKRGAIAAKKTAGWRSHASDHNFIYGFAAAYGIHALIDAQAKCAL